MSTPSTSNTALLFVTRQPAWEVPVKLRQSMLTDIFTARSGLEQRQCRKSRGRFQLEYTAVLDRAAAADREARATAEIAAPLVVPFWTERGILTTMVGDVATIDRDTGPDWFTAGEWVLFYEPGTGQQFRAIEAAAGNQLTLVPDMAALDFPDGSTVWPCRFCVRDGGTAQFTVPAEDAQEETLNYVTL